MTDLFNRDFALRIGPTPIEVRPATTPGIGDGKAQDTLRVVFTIEKTKDKAPNRAMIDVYNLSESNRELLKQYAGDKAQDFPVIVEAGYMNKREMLFKGDILTADSFSENTEWLTPIEASDGGKKYASKRFSKSYGPGTTVVSMLREVITAFEIGPGNALAQLAISPRGFTTFQKGVVVEGKISNILDKYISSAGYQWSIQDEQLMLVGPGQANQEPVVSLDQNTGLVGSPEKGEKGKIVFRALLQSSIRPGRRVLITSRTANGTFVVERAKYTGDTWGNEWTVEAEATPEKLG